MSINENQYERKAQFNENRETYVDNDGNYVYLVWDVETHRYRKEVCIIGENGFTNELRVVLDDLDVCEERINDADRHHRDTVFSQKMNSFYADESEFANNPLEEIPQQKQQPFESVVNENPQIQKLLKAMEKLTPEQIDLIYDIYGSMRFGADIAQEQGVSRQAINNRLKKIRARLEKLMAEMQ